MDEYSKALKEVENEKERIKDIGRSVEQSLFGATANLFGLILSAVSIVAAIRPETSRWIIITVILACFFGLISIWWVYYLHRKGYQFLMGAADECINHAKKKEDNGSESKTASKAAESFKWAFGIEAVSYGLAFISIVFFGVLIVTATR